MPVDWKRYPTDWPTVSHRIRFERAKGQCEWCGAQHGKAHPITGSKVVLTVAHLHGHDTMDCRDEVLVSLCQRCHNRYDAPMRAAHARVTRVEKKGGQIPLPLLEEVH